MNKLFRVKITLLMEFSRFNSELKAFSFVRLLENHVFRYTWIENRNHSWRILQIEWIQLIVQAKSYFWSLPFLFKLKISFFSYSKEVLIRYFIRSIIIILSGSD